MICDEAAGRVIEPGETARVFGDPQDEHTRTLPAAIPRINPEWDRRRRELR
ncbi:hypothetical protein [Nonomuraea sp. NPDC002799]